MGSTTTEKTLHLYYTKRLARLKFKLTNQDSEGGKTALSRRQCLLTEKALQATFLTGDGTEYSRKWIYNSKNHIRLQKVKNMKHFESPSFQFGKNESPTSGNSLVVRRVSPGRKIVDT